MAERRTWDVLIAGGGLAGQAMARQLQMSLPDLSIVVVDPLKRPLPPAAFKVGEATSELAAHYFAERLELKDHLVRDHLVKCGLRFFFGDSQGALHRRPEYGPRLFPPVTSYQLDRGKLENHLRQANEAAGVTLWEGYVVQECILGESPAPHSTVVRNADTGETIRLGSTWVVDCSGRQRIIQKRLGLGCASPLQHSACWFRVAGKCDVAQLVPPEENLWHERVPGGIRFHSTNHLMGSGYWVWLIPLSSANTNTSIGIVVDERMHPIATLDSHAKAMAWLRIHEPSLARHLEAFEVMDFKAFKEFSYATTQFYSQNRWACSGEAAMFTDPFYSPGSDFIALGNTVITRLIREHFQQSLTGELVERYNGLMLLLQRAFTEVFRDLYPMFGSSRVMTSKVVWDNASYWVFVCQMFFQGILILDGFVEQYRELFERYYQLNLKVQQLFRDWGRRSRDSRGFDYVGYADFEIAVRSHLELATRKSPRRFLDWIQLNLDRFSAWAIVLFLIAVEDVAPESLGELREAHLTVDMINLEQLDDAIRRSRPSNGGQRHPLAREILSLKRQMTKLFPEFTCLQPA